MGSKLYVGNLSYNTTSSDLEQLFAAHGSVQSAEVILKHPGGTLPEKLKASQLLAFIAWPTIARSRIRRCSRGIDSLSLASWIRRLIRLARGTTAGACCRSRQRCV
jgi:RNA recognition motif-containing protein